MISSSPDNRPVQLAFQKHACYFQSSHHSPGWISRDQLSLTIDDLGFRQGVVAVERLRTYLGRVFCAERHLNRWNQTLADLRIASVDSSIVTSLLDELIDKNRSLVQLHGDVGITIFATPGGPSSPTPTLCLHLNPIDHSMVNLRRDQGQIVVVTDVQQPSSQCWPRTAKVRSRIHYYLADHNAREQDPSAIGLLVDDDGTMTETSVANIAIVEAGCVISPESSQILTGITQSIAMECAASASINWTRDRITADRLRTADEVLLMGTDTGLWFASRVDETEINQGKRGSVCERLQQIFLDRT